jgi:selenide,water dikinase
MDRAILKSILAGGAEKALEADTVIAGGHSIFDHEPKYGMAVTGMIDPRKVLRNDTCKTGDALILTKPLGVGLVMAALRAGEAAPDEVKAATDSMERLNRWAAEKFALDAGKHIHACTDVTGFGLAVHAAEMAGSSHTLAIDCASLPLLPGALAFAKNYFATAAGQRNRNYMEGKIDTGGVSPAMQEILFDPQTSGGLLISAAPEAAAELCDAIQANDPAAAIIGEVSEREAAVVLAL